MTFRKGMLVTFELVLVGLTCAWIAGFVELMRHLESLAHNTGEGLGAAVAFGGVLLFCAWALWLCAAWYNSQDKATFINIGLLVATMLGGWIAGLVLSIIYLQGAPESQVVSTLANNKAGSISATLVISGILVLTFLICWFWIGIEAWYRGRFIDERRR